MALKAVLPQADWEKLGDDAIKALYEERDGKHILAVAAVDGWALEDVKALKATLAKEREAARKHAEALANFGDLDPDEARKAISRLADIKNWDGDRKVKEQVDALTAQLTDKYGKEIKQRDESIVGMTRQLEQHLVTAAASEAMNKHRGNAGLLMPHIKQRTKVERADDGSFVARVLDDHGHIRITSRAGSTDPMSISELVEEMRGQATHAPAFEGSGASGSGANGTAGSARAGSPRAFQISATDARDPARYRAVRAAADKAGSQVEIVT